MTELKRIRIERNLKQCQLAKDAGVSTFSLSRYENGWMLPSLTNAIKIAQTLECNVDVVFPGLDNNGEKV